MKQKKRRSPFALNARVGIIKKLIFTKFLKRFMKHDL